MQQNDLLLLRRREFAGTVAWVAWAVWLVVKPFNHPFTYPNTAIAVLLMTVSFPVAWLFTAAWVYLDSRYRRRCAVVWMLFTLLTGPVGFLLYYLTRPPIPPICSRCGSASAGSSPSCPTCGHAAPIATIKSAAAEVYSSFANALVRGPVERAKETAKHMCFAFAAMVVISALLYRFEVFYGLMAFIGLMLALSAAAYWVLVAWWVYLDAAWRRMDGVPWAILTLITNVVGLVTYLVIRYPDPRLCHKCGAGIPNDQKYCAFCGSEAEPMCPHCQSPIKPGWQFCPSCAARLTSAEVIAKSISTDGITITGSVVDADGSPIPGAGVAIDSRENGKSVTTDSLGRFQLTGLDRRPYVLIASADGYATQSKAYTPGSSGLERLHFSLRRQTASSP